MCLSSSLGSRSSLVVERHLISSTSRQLIRQANEELSIPSVGRTISRFNLHSLATILTNTVGGFSHEWATNALLCQIEALEALAFHIAVHDDVLPFLYRLGDLSPNTEVVEVVFCSALFYSQVEGNALQTLAAVTGSHVGRNLYLSREVLPLGGEVHVTDTSPVLVVARITMCLCASRSSLVGSIVELNVQLRTCGQSLAQVDPELSIPVGTTPHILAFIVLTSHGAIGRLHHNTAAIVLTCTCNDGCTCGLIRRSFLGNETCHVVRSQVTVDNQVCLTLRNDNLVLIIIDDDRSLFGFNHEVLNKTCTIHLDDNGRVFITLGRNGHIVNAVGLDDADVISTLSIGRTSILHIFAIIAHQGQFSTNHQRVLITLHSTRKSGSLSSQSEVSKRTGLLRAII